jgi:3alpha(or 20beta)-hydroxysteroid dehydrogenase
MRMGRLEQRVVLVTGGASGIGAATVRRFVAEGASVVIADIQDELGKRLASELGDRALYLHLDVSREDDWARAIDATVKHFGKLDGLVNDAGIFEWLPLRDYPLANYMRIINVNQVGVFLGMRAVVPEMEKAGGGTIVNISSGAGLTGVAGALAYTASKFAVTGMTKTAALELRPLGIRVNSVHPGFVKTPLTMLASGEPDPEDHPADSPMGEPEELANLILYLTSDESSYSTGSEFVADGGVMAGVSQPS